MGVALATDGSLYVTDADAHTIRRLASTGTMTNVAGTAGSKGSADGGPEVSRFFSPLGVAVDAQGAVYVADGENHTVRKITSAGTVSTIAGTAGIKGSTDGPGTAAQFNLPHGIALAPDGTLYVADTFNHTIRKISPAGEVTTLAGSAGQKGSADGVGAAARFYHPAGLAVDAQGSLYVADNGNQTIRKITAAGNVRTVAGTAGRKGAADGTGAAASFRFPTGLAVDAIGNLYVADFLNFTIRKISPTGEVTTLAGAELHSGHADGPGQVARFKGPVGIAADTQGVLYVADGSTIRLIK